MDKEGEGTARTGAAAADGVHLVEEDDAGLLGPVGLLFQRWDVGGCPGGWRVRSGRLMDDDPSITGKIHIDTQTDRHTDGHMNIEKSTQTCRQEGSKAKQNARRTAPW